MLILICALLAFVALYCFGMWGFLAYRNWRQVSAYKRRNPHVELHAVLAAQLDTTERYTFHLGLCGILAIGLLGIILSTGAV